MAAVIQIDRWTGAGGSPTKTQVDGGVAWLVTSDAAQTDDMTEKPIKPTGAGETNYSYWATLRFNVTTGAGAGQAVGNLGVWFEGTGKLSANVDLMYGLMNRHDGTDGGYRQATGTPGETGTELSLANHNALVELPGSVYVKNADTAEGEGNAFNVNGWVIGAAGDDEGFDGLVLQVKCNGAITDDDLGALAEITVHWKADDTSL